MHRGEKPGVAEAPIPPLVGASTRSCGAPPAAAGGARGADGGGGGGLAGGEAAGGGLTRPEARRRAWPMRLRAAGGEWGREGRGGRVLARRPPRVRERFGRRFFARRVGFSARSNLRLDSRPGSYGQTKRFWTCYLAIVERAMLTDFF